MRCHAAVDRDTYRRLYSDFVAANPALERDSDHRRESLRVGHEVDVHPGAALLRPLQHDPGSGLRHPRGAGAGDFRRLGDDRSHQPRRSDQEDVSRRALPSGARRLAGGLQQLRCPARKRSRHDPRNLRERADPQSHGSGRGGRRHPSTSRIGEQSCRSTRRRSAIRRRGFRSSSSRDRSTVPAAPGIGRPKARAFSGSGRSSRRASSGSTARTWCSWAFCPASFSTASSAQSLKLDGSETFDIEGLEADVHPRQKVDLTIRRA